MRSLCLENLRLATYVRPFLILGLKNPLTDNPAYKACFVCHGLWITDGDCEQVFYSGASSAPTNMTRVRSVVAYGQLSGGGSTTADAEQAFIQLELDNSEHMCVTVPPKRGADEMKEDKHVEAIVIGAGAGGGCGISN